MRYRVHFQPLDPVPVAATVAPPTFPRDDDHPQQKTNRVTGPHQVTVSEAERRKVVQLWDGMFPKYAGMLEATVVKGDFVGATGKTAKRKAPKPVTT